MNVGCINDEKRREKAKTANESEIAATAVFGTPWFKHSFTRQRFNGFFQDIIKTNFALPNVVWIRDKICQICKILSFLVTISFVLFSFVKFLYS